MHGQGQGLAWTIRQWQGEELAVERQSLARECLAHDGDVLAGSGQWLVKTNAMPTLRDLGARHPEPEAETSARQCVQCCRRHGGVGWRAARDLEDRRADVDTIGLRGHPRQHGRRIGTVCLSSPHHRVTDGIGFPGQGQVVRVVACAPIPQIQSQSHGATLGPKSQVRA